jgi:membrane-associated protease RseP (regulator of RpoE activity)
LIAYLIFFGLALTQGKPVIEGDAVVPTTTVGRVVELDGGQTTAGMIGLQPRDMIVAIDGAETPEWDDLVAALEGKAGEAIDITIVRDSEQMVLSGQLGTRVVDGAERGFLGISPAPLIRDLGVGESILDAGNQFAEGVRFTFVSFARLLKFDSLGQIFGGLFGGEVDDEVRPVSLVGIVQLGAQSDAVGVATIAFILAIINIVLGVINVLPLFPLDGGHFAVAVYEKLSGRTADVRKLIPVAVLVIAFLSIFGLAAIILDIVDPIKF